MSKERVESVARRMCREYWHGRGENLTKEQEDEFWLSWRKQANLVVAAREVVKSWTNDHRTILDDYGKCIKDLSVALLSFSEVKEDDWIHCPGIENTASLFYSQGGCMRQRFITDTERAIIEAAHGWRDASKSGDDTGRMVWIDSLADAVDSDKRKRRKP